RQLRLPIVLAHCSAGYPPRGRSLGGAYARSARFGRLRGLLLVVEQQALAVEAPAEAAEASVGGDDAVAGDDDRRRVAPARVADGPRRVRLADRFGDLAIGTGFARRDPRELSPHLQLERGATQVDREVERGAAPVDAPQHLGDRRRERAVVAR